MILRRSSSRCSRKPMAPMDSFCSGSMSGTSATISGIGGLGSSSRFGCGRRGFGGRWVGRRRRRINQRSAGNGSFRPPAGRQDLWRGFALQVGDLGFDLRSELVRSPLELVQRLADLAPDLGKLLGPKNDERQEEQKQHFRESEVHVAMI